MNKRISFLHLVLFSLLFCTVSEAQQRYLLKPSYIFDGEQNTLLQNMGVLVENNQIMMVGRTDTIRLSSDVEIIDLQGYTLLPGLIEGHSHLLLHPYNETSWNDQVLKESLAERVVRASVHAQNTLMAGFTTIRDLGTEGAGYADVGIKTAIEKGVIPGPRVLTTTKAIVATGSYGPKGFAPEFDVLLGAEPADGYDTLIKVTRSQMGQGADWIKVYADYRWGPNGETMPSFSLEELKVIVETAKSSGRFVVAHASSEEGMRRAILAGVRTIEHGDGGTAEIFKQMASHDVAFCPTLAAGDAITQYNGWKKGIEPEPERISNKRKTFQLALQGGVTICNGSDVGVFTHGANAIEIELLADYGLSKFEALKAATSTNASIFGLENKLGRIKVGLLADIIAVEGNPLEQLDALHKVVFVMKDGKIYKRP